MGKMELQTEISQLEQAFTFDGFIRYLNQEESPLPGVSRWILKPGSYQSPTTGLSMNIPEKLSKEGGFNHTYIQREA